jgi:hypothetical protein
LKKVGLVYEIQYTFNDCLNIKKLPFDFYLPEYNICIEYDGEQHFRPIDYFGGLETFNKQKERDNIKNKYCENNNIEILRIAYYDYKNIEYIIKSKLNI